MFVVHLVCVGIRLPGQCACTYKVFVSVFVSVCLCISYVQFMLVLVVQCVHKVCGAIRCPGQHPMEGLVGFAITQLQLPHAQPSVSSVHRRVNSGHGRLIIINCRLDTGKWAGEGVACTRNMLACEVRTLSSHSSVHPIFDDEHSAMSRANLPKSKW